MTGRILPIADDHDTGAVFAAAARGELVVRVCTCGRVLHLPVPYCYACGAADGTWVTASGDATLLTWTTVTQQMHPGYPVPYTVVIVALDDHPQVHLLGMIDGTPELHAGQPMVAWFERLDDDTYLPQFRPA